MQLSLASENTSEREPAQARPPVVNLVGVHRSFGDIQAVRDVSLSVGDGEFLILLGPSGSGKTTLLRIIAGFEEATRGEIFVRGQSVERKPPNERNIGVVFQNLALFPHLSVFRNVSFGLEMKHVPADEIRQRVGEALEMVRLGGFAERRPSQLSGGQQQRVALARALVIRPDVLLLDEPLGALDRDLRTEMQSEIRRLQQQLRITAVMVTHDQEEAMIMGDRIAVLRDGQLRQVGEPSEVYERPVSAFVARFIGAANVLPVGMLEREGGLTKATLASGGIAIRTAETASGPAEGTCIVVRPEAISVGPEAAGLANRFSGRVLESTYLGVQTRLKVAIAPGVELGVWIPTKPDGLRPRPGEVVPIGWPAEAALLVPA